MHADYPVNTTVAERSATNKELRKFVAFVFKEVNSDVLLDVQIFFSKISKP